jgi:hypothetical protein
MIPKFEISISTKEAIKYNSKEVRENILKLVYEQCSELRKNFLEPKRIYVGLEENNILDMLAEQFGLVTDKRIDAKTRKRYQGLDVIVVAEKNYFKVEGERL